MREWIRDHRLALQDVTIAVVLSTIVVSLLAFAHAWAANTTEASRCFTHFFSDTQWPKWIGCALSAHENLAGGLIGSAGTIFAAWLAWRAIVKRSNDAHLLVVKEITPWLDTCKLIWRVIDSAMNYPDGARLNSGLRSIKIISPRTQNFVSLTSHLTELSKELHPADRRRFDAVYEALRSLYFQIEIDIEGVKPKVRLHGIRTQLSHLAKYLSAFDAVAGASFAKGHMRVTVDQRSAAKHFEPLVEKFEQTGHF